MRYFFLSIFFIASLLKADDFLEPEQAFKTALLSTQDSIDFTITLDKTIYLYDEFLKVTITKPEAIDITKELQIRDPEEYDGFQVHFNELLISVPKSLIIDKVGENIPYELEFGFQGCSKAGLCYAPMSKTFVSKVEDTVKVTTTTKKLPLETSPPVNETDTITQTLAEGNILLVLATFFGFGLLLSLTPCIFPMIPILSSIIVQHSKQHNGEMSSSQGFFLSLIYVLSMSLAYTIAGILAGLFGANLQAMLQDPVVLIVFAGVFIALALSLFGYFEIGLPASWQTRLSKKSEQESQKGGIVGVAIMGFLSALIVGPCVAPPLAGALIYIGQTGDALLGGAALFVMSLGMGAPLLLIGLGAGRYMPKPGGWMEQVSKLFGIIMLAIALWMLERVISDTLFMYLSAILLIGTSIYFAQFKHIILQTLRIVILIYGVAVFIGAISGSKNILDPLQALKGGQNVVLKNGALQWQYVSSLDELESMVSMSNQPVMLDFWATWCVSCKELDNITFKDEEVIEFLKPYKLLKVDVTKNTSADQELMKHFNIFGPPALIFFENGTELKAKRIIGYKNPKEFLEIAR